MNQQGAYEGSTAPEEISAEAGFTLNCSVNGRPVSAEVPPSRRLLTVLREDLELTGTKRACEMGRCGACMVLIDGRPVNACLTMAYQCAGSEITTIEGLSEAGLHPVQRAFLEEGGFQCGYCTPGMVISVVALLEENPQPSQDEVEEALSGNICRCTGYGGIMRAVNKAIERGVG
ncbi:(2Fe-2S)-binding protein [Paenibacillus sp. BR2-3]|uniref:(2Fe-2S)-binding protein n=1 Tax=Paenibacillus sp. BR2-3 TaxID=3048494 RepID=UPI003977910C